ncbi:uncharacterized protein LOC123260554 [Cotesia glomerata]|uniref:uncharacterized protein LOC123260554 n=1 Tax=Cotesia glomerata TaxID=32391 RepID=UPI001D00F0FA|nr:uncharacterized protein LOC123260554 [Cotesia glomerata]
MGKKRSRSRSRSRSRESRRKKEDKWEKLQARVDNLTKVVEMLANVQQEQRSAVNSHVDSGPPIVTSDAEKDKNIESDSGKVMTETPEKPVMEPTDAESKASDQLEVGKWKIEGLPEKNKKEILESYKRKGDFYTEALKLNLEIIPLLSDIAKKRDEHFAETQNCVGTALCALGAAVSLLLDQPEEGVDEDALTNYISHMGQILTDVFYQQSVARKSYITSQLNKNIKPMVDTMLSKEWLYGDDLKEKVKDVKEIEKACASIKDKPTPKLTTKHQSQGNGRRRPSEYRQVGYNQRSRASRFKPRTHRSYQQQPYTQQSKTTSKTTSQSSLKK